jgi:S-methylmethionine-dependent homocysteine/selenocysteine methylase
MIQYGIFDEEGKLISEFENIEKGLEALALMNDGDIHPYQGNYEGYYTKNYELERGYYSCVCKGRIELVFDEGAKIEPISSDELAIILACQPCDELEIILETLDSEKAKSFFESLTVPDVEWDEKTRTATVVFYYFETEDTLDGESEISVKCPSFMTENS